MRDRLDEVEIVIEDGNESDGVGKIVEGVNALEAD